MSTPSRRQDIDALIAKMQSQYGGIEGLYKASLDEQEVKPDLKIEIKNFLENARSTLDYCAHDIADALGITAEKIYFPIVGKDKDKNHFSDAINRNLPGLESKNKDLFDYLESIQPYHADYAWLADFAKVTIDNKHSQLTPQTRTETVRQVTSVHSGGGRVSWAPNSVRFGAGVWINGAPVNPETQMPMPTPETTVTREVWIDFRFNSTISALPLMKKICDGIPALVNKIYELLQP